MAVGEFIRFWCVAWIEPPGSDSAIKPSKKKKCVIDSQYGDCLVRRLWPLFQFGEPMD